jgi:hypothetical protein
MILVAGGAGFIQLPGLLAGKRNHEWPGGRRHPRQLLPGAASPAWAPALLNVSVRWREMAWLDTATHTLLLEAAQSIAAIAKEARAYIGSQRWSPAEEMQNKGYGQYLLQILHGKIY